MATTDSNGILFYEDTDSVSPLHTLLNTGQQSVSDALDASARIFPVANVAARAALVATYSPSTTKPLIVRRTDAHAGQELEMTVDGTNWTIINHGTWTAYTPTLSAGTGSWSLGTTGAVNDCKWRYEGDLIRVNFRFVLGTGFTFPTADPRFTLPIAAVSLPHPFAVMEGVASARDVTTTGRQDLLHVIHANASTTVVQLVAGISPMGTPAITPTSPWTWAATHTLQGAFTYRPL